MSNTKPTVRVTVDDRGRLVVADLRDKQPEVGVMWRHTTCAEAALGISPEALAVIEAAHRAGPAEPANLSWSPFEGDRWFSWVGDRIAVLDPVRVTISSAVAAGCHATIANV